MSQTAIVTGGSRGIGFAIVRQLAEDGYNIVIFDLNSPDQYKSNLDILDSMQADYIYVQGNTTAAEDREKMLSMAVNKFGGVHVLVNNAGVGPKVRSDLLEMTEDSWDFVMNVNTKGNMFLTQAVVKQMLKQKITGKKRGTVINISSCSAEVSSTNRGEYCVSKAGVSMLTVLYADRLAAEGIFVHEVRPGVISTEMTSAAKEKYDALIAAGAFPIARWGQPEDVAGAVSALASDKFLYTTGNYLDVDGGFHIKRL